MFKFSSVFAIIGALFVLLVAALPTLAQATGDTPVETPQFLALIALTFPTFALVEMVKPAINAAKERYLWSDNVHQFVMRVAAFIAALILLFLTPQTANFFDAFAITIQVPPLVELIVTALAVSAGSAGLYALQTFLRPNPTAVIPIKSVETSATSTVSPPITNIIVE